jgi:hypothetical protein
MKCLSFLSLTLLIAFYSTRTSAQSQQASSERPKAIAIAETKLLMEGLQQPNFRALEKLLRGSSLDNEAWTFARGQALLLAESGNLLMLRPPRNEGFDSWIKLSVEMRERASSVAKFAGTRDLAQARIALVDLSNTCNRCHQSFRVAVKIRAFSADIK